MEARQQHRAVHVVGICGASASGKSVLAKSLVELLDAPVVALSADWYFHKRRAACRKCPSCWEQASSVDSEGLARDLSELCTALASAPPGPVPALTFGHSTHGVWGISKNRLAQITRPDATLTHAPVVVVVEGFLLFSDLDVCEKLHAGIWLAVEDGELLARRRFLRGGGCFEDEDEWADFRDEYINHIYDHHQRAAPGMLANASSALCGTINITESTTVDQLVAEAQALLEGGGRATRPVEGGAAVGSKRAAPDDSSMASPSSPTKAFDSPVSNPPPPCTPPPAGLSTPPLALSDTASSTYASSTVTPDSLIATPESTIAALPPGSRVAVLDFLGSFCPITTGHIQCMAEARRILVGEAPPINCDGALVPYAACLGALTVNCDAHVRSKLGQSAEEALSARQRLELCSLATASEAAWVRVGTPAHEWVESLRASFPSITFTVWMLNGADDVVRYEKWECASRELPFITMGRTGDTLTILEAIRTEHLASDAFVLGPELAGTSSTAARNALRLSDHATLSACLHPHVVTWLEQHGPYRKRVHQPTVPPPLDHGTLHVRGAGFGGSPRQLHAADFGVALPLVGQLFDGESGQRQQILLKTLSALEAASATGAYHRLAQMNLQRWRAQAPNRTVMAVNDAHPSCKVLVRAGDWGAVTLALTKEFGTTFAALNMANAVYPGGGYTHGMVAQEENMFRRTDCHFAVDRSHIDPTTEEYVSWMTSLLEARDGRVYLDTDTPRVCVRGPEERNRADMGYAWLADDQIFPFYELRSAAVDLRGGDRGFSEEETVKRVRAQLDTLAAAGVRHAVLSAFGCGAFMNPTSRVAAVYAEELRSRAVDFDVVAFAIFNAGYGPDNLAPFEAAFDSWRDGVEKPPREAADDSMGSPCASGSPAPLSSVRMPPPRPKKKGGRGEVDD